MKNLFPNKAEFAVLLALVAVSTLIAALTPQHDLGIAGASIPLFFVAAVLGLRRNWRLSDMKNIEQ